MILLLKPFNKLPWIKKDKYGRPRKRITLKPFAIPTRFLSSDSYESEDDFDDFSAEDFIREVRFKVTGYLIAKRAK